MKIKKYIEFLNEADQAPAPPSVPAPATPSPAQPAPQHKPASQNEVPSLDTPQTTTQTTETKSGDLSSYDNQEVTKNPDTVKKMVDMIKDMDKTQLIKLRNFIGELKDIEDPKTEIGKL